MTKPVVSPLLTLSFDVRRALNYPLTQPVCAADDILGYLETDERRIHDILIFQARQMLDDLARHAKMFAGGWAVARATSTGWIVRFASANGALARTVQIRWSELERRWSLCHQEDERFDVAPHSSPSNSNSSNETESKKMNLIEAIALAAARARGIRKMTPRANVFLANTTQQVLLSEQMRGCAGSDEYTVNENPSVVLNGREVIRLSVAYMDGYIYVASYEMAPRPYKRPLGSDPAYDVEPNYV